jgi:hypothetical protein
MFLHSSVVTLLSAIHLRTVYNIARKVQGEQSWVVTSVWVLAELVLPHLLLSYMQSGVQQHSLTRSPDVHHRSGSTGASAPKSLSNGRAETQTAASKLQIDVAAEGSKGADRAGGLVVNKVGHSTALQGGTLEPAGVFQPKDCAAEEVGGLEPAGQHGASSARVSPQMQEVRHRPS